MIVPTGNRRHGVERVPWLTGAIVAAACALLGHAELEQPDATPLATTQIAELLSFWESHPHVSVTAGRASRFALPGMHGRLTELRRTILASSAVPSPARMRADQRRIDAMVTRLEALQAVAPQWRLGLKPESRHVQLAWFSHGLAHTDWTHLALAALLFWITAPFVEALWGRLPFAVFCVAATGIGAAVFSFQAHRADLPLGGLSTIAAACAGVFAVHFLWRHVTVLVGLPPLLFGTYDLPGFLWGAITAGFATAAFLYHPLSPAALTAHGATLLFGVASAVVMSSVGFTVRLAGRDAIRDEEHPRFARRLYKSILRRHADRYDGLTEVARVALDREDQETAASAVDELLRRVIGRDDTDTLLRVVKEFVGRLQPDHLSHDAALIAAEVIAGDDAWLAESLYRSAADRADINDRALLQAAALNLHVLSRPREAVSYCERLLAANRSSVQITSEARALLAAAVAETERWTRTTRSAKARPITGPAPVEEVEHDFGFVDRQQVIREVELQPGDPMALETAPAETAGHGPPEAMAPSSATVLDVDDGTSGPHGGAGEH